MEEIVQLIEKFWNNTATTAELQTLQRLLHLHRQDFEAYFTNQYSIIDEQVTERITQQRASELLDSIHYKIEQLAETKTKAPSKLVSIKYWYGVAGAVAACAILIVGIFSVVNQQSQKLTDAAKASRLVPQGLVNKVNSTNAKQEVLLADGSVIVLYPKSAVSYNQPFTNNKRDINLVGTAIFKVAKDKTKPFTVHANGIATTALGTTFKVVANQASVNVQLFEGNVVIQKIGVVGIEKYLLPNQQLVYNLTTDVATITTISTTTLPLANSTTAKTNSKLQPANKAAKSLLFKAQPFTEVIAQLEKQYNTTITIEALTVNTINVTAEFTETDKLIDILNTICGINGLSVTQQGNTYIIK